MIMAKNAGAKSSLLNVLYFTCFVLSLAPSVVGPPERNFTQGQPELQQAMDNMISEEQFLKRTLRLPSTVEPSIPVLLSDRTNRLLEDAERMLSVVQDSREKQWMQDFIRKLQTLKSVVQPGNQKSQLVSNASSIRDFAQSLNSLKLSQQQSSSNLLTTTVPDSGPIPQQFDEKSKVSVTQPGSNQVKAANDLKADHFVTKPGLSPAEDVENQDDLVRELESLHKLQPDASHQNSKSVKGQNTEVLSQQTTGALNKQTAEETSQQTTETLRKLNAETLDQQSIGALNRLDAETSNKQDTEDKQNVEGIDQQNTETLDEQNTEILNQQNTEAVAKQNTDAFHANHRTDVTTPSTTDKEIEEKVRIENEKEKIKEKMAEEIAELKRLGDSEEEIIRALHFEGKLLSSITTQKGSKSENLKRMDKSFDGHESVKRVLTEEEERNFAKVNPSYWNAVPALHSAQAPRQIYMNNTFLGMHISIPPMNPRILRRQFRYESHRNPIMRGNPYYRGSFRDNIQARNHQNFLLRNHIFDAGGTFQQDKPNTLGPVKGNSYPFTQPDNRYPPDNPALFNYPKLNAKAIYMPYPLNQKSEIKNKTLNNNKPVITTNLNKTFPAEFSDEMKRQLRDGKVILLSDSVVRSNFTSESEEKGKKE